METSIQIRKIWRNPKIQPKSCWRREKTLAACVLKINLLKIEMSKKKKTFGSKRCYNTGQSGGFATDSMEHGNFTGQMISF